MKNVACLIYLLTFSVLFRLDRSEAAITSAQPASTLAHEKTWNQMSTMEKIQTVCVIPALIAFLVSEVWFIVAGFKTSVFWGLFMLFIGGARSMASILIMIGWMIMWTKITHETEAFHLPMMIFGAYVIFAGCGAIVFIVGHWNQARKPLAVMGLGVLLVLAVLVLEMAK